MICSLKKIGRKEHLVILHTLQIFKQLYLCGLFKQWFFPHEKSCKQELSGRLL